jgi:hypothetical protein
MKKSKLFEMKNKAEASIRDALIKLEGSTGMSVGRINLERINIATPMNVAGGQPRSKLIDVHIKLELE